MSSIEFQCNFNVCYYYYGSCERVFVLDFSAYLSFPVVHMYCENDEIFIEIDVFE